MNELFDRMIDRRRQGSCKWTYAASAVGGDFEDTLALTTADMDFPTAPAIHEALRNAVDEVVCGYTLPTKAFYDAVISWMQRRHNWTVEKDWIVCSPGIVSALFYFLHGFTKPGDGVIIQSPVYTPFSRSIQATGRILLNNSLVYENGNYRMDFDGLAKKAAMPEAKMMFLCSPHNPVGRCWTYYELEQVAKICTENDIFLVSDEIHFDFVYPPHKHTVFALLPEKLTRNIAVCTSPSKSFNIAGLQISNIIIPNTAIRRQFIKGKNDCGSELLNVFSYVACTAAYDRSEDWFDSLLQYLHENDADVRDYIQKHLPQLKAVPLEATYLQWLDFSGLKKTQHERERFLREKLHLVFESGRNFGKEGESFERFNIACSLQTIRSALQRLRDMP